MLFEMSKISVYNVVWFVFLLLFVNNFTISPIYIFIPSTTLPHSTITTVKNTHIFKGTLSYSNILFIIILHFLLFFLNYNWDFLKWTRMFSI